MMKIILVFIITLLVISGCQKDEKSLYLPEANNDKIFTVVGGEK